MNRLLPRAYSAVVGLHIVRGVRAGIMEGR
jgi:hypothetical protein